MVDPVPMVVIGITPMVGNAEISIIEIGAMYEINPVSGDMGLEGPRGSLEEDLRENLTKALISPNQELQRKPPIKMRVGATTIKNMAIGNETV